MNRLRQFPHSFAYFFPLLVVLSQQVAAQTVVFIDAERELAARYGKSFANRSQEEISGALVQLAERLPVGGAIHLPQSVACGTLDFRRVADDVQITGGHGGTIVLGGGQQGLQLLFCRLDQRIEYGIARPAAARRPLQLAAAEIKDIRIFDGGARPMSNLFALFCEGSIQIKNDVENCAWIAGTNAFGRRTVTTEARVDRSLFLWFGINWPFQDYNGFLDPKNKGRDWLENAQMWFDCKGGGEGTRMYLLVETNYGNPGPSVVLQNCKGLAMYHGSTERGSAQGPGMYWLKNCEDVKLGLRRVFSAVREGPRAAMPSHDLTIEGGKAVILHNNEFFGNAQEASAVNSCPSLQVWSSSFDFENQGFDGKEILKFAYTPRQNRPEGPSLKQVENRLERLVSGKLDLLKLEANDANKKLWREKFLSGRDIWHPINARDEITFMYGDDDLTKGPMRFSNGLKLPPPPSMPPTDAPRLRRAIEFTQAADFGKELLAAGADPTGTRPADDAFAKLMFGMSRDEVQKLLEQTYAADAEYRAAQKADDKQRVAGAQARLANAMLKLHPIDPNEKGKTNEPRRLRRPPLHLPPGTFLLTKPLVLVGGWKEVWGAGPDKTVLKATGDFKVVEQHEPGTIANFTVEGGRVGLAITGADHDKGFSPTLQSYIAGQNYYNLTFRNQTFAGIHVGNDNPEVMGGAEHDQNKYVDLKFENTGDFGIYMNQNMLDKWLCLHNEFRGQKKAGISIKFNNLIHGAVIGCKFNDINGPGLDFMGGNPEIRFRSHQVMIDQCEFIECGSADQPAVDQGAGVCMAFTRANIVTKNKTIKAGYRGGAAIYEDVAIDVKTAAGEPAMVLRGARHNQTGRPNGHMLRGVRCSGGLGFVNDANAYNAMYRKTAEQRGFSADLNWDVNPAAHELAPRNGWVHPFVLYDCQFADKRFAYSLLNVDVDNNKVLNDVDLSKLAQ